MKSNEDKMFELIFDQVDELVSQQMPVSDPEEPFDEDAFSALYTAICEQVFENRDSYPWWSEAFEEDFEWN